MAIRPITWQENKFNVGKLDKRGCITASTNVCSNPKITSVILLFEFEEMALIKTICTI